MTTLGQFAHAGTVGAPHGGGIRLGMHAVVREGTRAVLHHSRAAHHRFVASPPSVPYLRDELAAVGHRAGAEVTVESLLHFAYQPGNLPDAWLDLGGDVKRPHRFRRRLGGRYPIAVVHHSVSYGYCLHDWFLPILLGDWRACDAIVCTSPSARNVILRTLDYLSEDFRRRDILLAYHGQVPFIPLGVDCDRFCPRDRREAQVRFGLAPDGEYLLWVGRISSQDKADLVPLLGALRKIREAHPDAKLLVSGTPRDVEAQVLAAAAESAGVAGAVVALGAVVDDDLPWLYAAADVLVSPVDSIQEMFGLTVVEAMACGLPVVCSDWGGYRDSVVGGETGILVPTYRPDPDLATDVAEMFGEWSLYGGEMLDQFAHAQSTVVDMGALAAAVAGLLDNPVRRLTMGEAGRRRAYTTYDWPGVIAQLDDLMVNLADHDATPTAPIGYERPHFAEVFHDYPTRRVPMHQYDHSMIADSRPHIRLGPDAVKLDAPSAISYCAAWSKKYEAMP